MRRARRQPAANPPPTRQVAGDEDEGEGRSSGGSSSVEAGELMAAAWGEGSELDDAGGFERGGEATFR